MLLCDAGGLMVRGHLQFGLNAVSERKLFWDLAATTAPDRGLDPETRWLDGYIKPGLNFESQLHGGAEIYGKVSAVSSYTWGTDAFDTGDTGETTLKKAYLAIRGDLGSGVSYDLSLGPRELTLGTGLLIANGATSGFERGALKFWPRKAWERAVIARMSYGNAAGTAFHLDPNELPSKDGRNELAGVDLRYDDLRGGHLGATYVDVLNSDSPYPQAAPGGIGAPTVMPGAREGTGTLGIYGKTNPFAGTLENQDTWTLRYAHIRANELNSPVQFGQTIRVDLNGTVVSGVTDAHLADELFVECSRIVNRNTHLTAGVSVSFPERQSTT